MRFIVLGYAAPEKFETMPETERNVMVDTCLAYDDQLRAAGHFVGGDALQPAASARTLRPNKGKVLVTDGPYAETKEQIGGFMMLEARDLDHAVELISKHPAVTASFTTFEIRAVSDIWDDVVRESERRRGKK